MTIEQEKREARNAMLSAMGEGFTDTPESLKHERRLNELRNISGPSARADIIGDMYLRAFA